MYYGLLWYVGFSVLLMYMWQMLFLILGIAVPLILVYTSIGIWLLKRTPKRKAGEEK